MTNSSKFLDLVDDINSLVAAKASGSLKNDGSCLILHEKYRIEILEPGFITPQGRSFTGALCFDERKESTFGDLVGAFYTGGCGDYIISRLETDGVVDVYGISYAPNPRRSGTVPVDAIVKVTSTRCHKNILRLKKFTDFVTEIFSKSDVVLTGVANNNGVISFKPDWDSNHVNLINVLIPCIGKTIYEMVGNVSIVKERSMIGVKVTLSEMVDGKWEELFPEDYADVLLLDKAAEWLEKIVK